MNENECSVLQTSNVNRKRKEAVQLVSSIKKLRSNIPRRRRFQISPITRESSNSLVAEVEIPELSQIRADCSSSSSFPGEISTLSTWITVRSDTETKKPRSTRRKKNFDDVKFGAELPNSQLPEIFSDEEHRPVTRLYYRKKIIEREVDKKDYEDLGVELSESSCLESSSGAHYLKFGELVEKNWKLKDRAHNEQRNDLISASDANSLSEVSCIQHENSQFVKQGEFAENAFKSEVVDSTGDQLNEVSENFLFESNCVSVDQALKASTSVLSEVTNRAPELSVSVSEISRNFVESNLDFASSEFTVDQKPKELDLEEYSLTCSEKDLSYEDDSEILYGMETEYFPNNSSVEFSDYSSSMLVDSLGDSSQQSDENSAPPTYLPFFLQYQKQFCELSSCTDKEGSAKVQEFSDEFTLLKFENEEHEDSYKKFRSRERRLVLYDYADEYDSTTEFGDLVLQQRLLMVNWIVEQSEVMEFQSETTFLGVSLLDQFLSRGFFKHKKKLQILGIACLTLATRLEENQPYNSVRQNAFYVGENVYSRAEVIGMEWLVQEILNFQCYLPTIYNFLWFYLKAAKADAEIEKRTKYLAVLSLLDHERLWYWPSTVAAGLVILASLAADQESSCQWVMEAHVRTKNDDLPECIQNLEWLVKYVC